MTPKEFLESQRRYREKRKLLEEIIIDMSAENDRINNEYALEHAPYTPGQQVELPEGTGFFAFANVIVNYTHGKGEQLYLKLYFYGKTKSGRRTKQYDWKLTQRIPIKG
jgi:hypothetical protein